MDIKKLSVEHHMVELAIYVPIPCDFWCLFVTECLVLGLIEWLDDEINYFCINYFCTKLVGISVSTSRRCELGGGYPRAARLRHGQLADLVLLQNAQLQLFCISF